LTAYLQSLQNMGLLNIVRTGDCAGYTWNIRWNQGGKKDTLTVILFKFFKILTIKMQKYLLAMPKSHDGV